MTKADVIKFDVPDTTPIVVRLFINGQYVTTARIVDNFNYISDRIEIDADFEVFEQEKK